MKKAAEEEQRKCSAEPKETQVFAIFKIKGIE